MADDDQRVVFLERDVATELLDLVDDTPGEADEELLDEVVEAIDDAGPGLPGEAQQAVARGDAVAIGLEPEDAEVLTTLIEANTETDKRRLRAVGATIATKLKTAAKKARRRRKR